MNALNDLSQQWVPAIWALSLQVALLVAIIWVVSLCCRRASPQFRYGLWLIVLVRLCLPFGFVTPLGVGQHVETLAGKLSPATMEPVTPAETIVPIPIPAEPISARPMPTPDQPSRILAVSEPGGPSTSQVELTWESWLALGWMSAVGILAALIVFRTYRIRQKIQACEIIDRSELTAILEHLRAESGLKRRVEFRCADDSSILAMPAVIGVFRPTILIPRRMLETWTPEETEPILLHELAHIRRKDPLVNLVQMFLQTLYFFHPLVWIANWKIRQERELACDDEVVRRIGGEPQRYGESILKLVKAKTREPLFGFTGLGMAERRSSLGKRILRIMNENYRLTKRMGKLATALVILLGAISIAIAAERKQADTGAVEEDTTPALEVAQAPDLVPGTPLPNPPVSVPAPFSPVTVATPSTPQVYPEGARFQARKMLGELNIEYSRKDFVMRALEGDIVAVRYYLLAGMNPNTETDEGTALEMASITGQTDVVKLLLQHGVDLKIRNQGQRAFINAAGQGGSIDAMKLLLDHGMDVNGKDRDGDTALIEAAKYGHAEIVPFLLEKRADINAAGRGGMTALMWAVSREHTELTRLLVERGADFTMTDERHRTALLIGIEQHNDQVVDNLLSSGATLNADSEGTISSLFNAVAEENHRVITKLLDMGASVDLMTARGKTLLTWAIELRHVDIVRLLLGRGANIYAKGPGGNSPLHQARIMDGPDTLQFTQLLLENATDIVLDKEVGERILVDASKWGTSELVRKLVDAGIDVNALSGAETPLIAASRSGHIDVVRTLLDNGANVGWAGRNGMFPLAAAVENGHAEVVRLLLDSGADPSNEIFFPRGTVPAGSRREPRRLDFVAIQKGHLDIAGMIAKAIQEKRRAVQKEESPQEQDLSVQAENRSRSATNLKRMGLVLKLYANDNQGRWPSIDDKRGNLMVEGEEIFPTYLSDVSVLVSPLAPKPDPDLPETAEGITDHSYFYLGWVTTNETEAMGVLDAYESMDLDVQRDLDLNVEEGKGNGGSDTIFRTREGIERFLIADINDPQAGSRTASSIPAMWERPHHHNPKGGNVLFNDGHVEFLRYPGKFPMSRSFIERLERISAQKEQE